MLGSLQHTQAEHRQGVHCAAWLRKASFLLSQAARIRVSPHLLDSSRCVRCLLLLQAACDLSAAFLCRQDKHIYHYHCFVNRSDGTWEGDELVRDVVHPQACLSDLRISQVSAGGMHSCALTDAGEVTQKPTRNTRFR